MKFNIEPKSIKVHESKKFLYASLILLALSLFLHVAVFTNSSVLNHPDISLLIEKIRAIPFICGIVAVTALFHGNSLNPENILFEIVKYGKLFLFMNFGMLLYYVFILNTTNDFTLHMTSLSMFISSLAFTISASPAKRAARHLGRKLYLVQPGGKINKKSAFHFWVLNLDFTKRAKGYTRKDILKNCSYFRILLIIPICVHMMLKRGPSPLLLIVLVRPIAFIIDLAFSMVTYVNGRCVSYELKDVGEHSRSHVYLIESRDNGRIIKYYSSDPLNFRRGSTVRIYYTFLSKYILNHRTLRQ